MCSKNLPIVRFMLVIILFILPIIKFVHLPFEWKRALSTTHVASYNTSLRWKKVNDYYIGALQTIEYSLQVMTPGMKKMSLKKPFQLQLQLTSIFSLKYSPIILAQFLVHLATYYSKNCASIIHQGLIPGLSHIISAGIFQY